MTEPDYAAIIDLARKATETELHVLVDDRALALVTPDDRTITRINLDDYALTPARHQGTARFRAPDSFLHYLTQVTFAGDGTTWEHQIGYYASPNDLTVTAVLNDDGPDPGHGDYRAELTYERTDEWKAWTHANTKFVNAVAFGEWIEDWRHTIVTPDAASIVDMVRKFRATRKVVYKDEITDRNGDRSLQWTQETTAGTSTSGTLELPDVFTLELRPFIGANPITITARFRYRLDDGGATFGVVLAQPDHVLREAFEAELFRLQDQLPEGVLIMLGSPAR